MLVSRSTLLFGLVSAGLSVLFACSSTSPSAPAGCQDSLCAKNNKCIDDGKTNECRLLCSKQEDCPDNYRCMLGPKSDKTYCSPLTGTTIKKKDKGQWGAHCAAILDAKKQPTAAGLDANPDCDTEQNFWCYAQNPTDGEAFCTQYQCGSDSDCKGGYWCATINVGPDIRTVRRTVKSTTTVCLPRQYCATCTSDVDCPAQNGVTQHCVAGKDDKKFCAPECQNNGNCQKDAQCVAVDDHNVCYPRAGVCKGDGQLCAPCYSDDDCPNGACVQSPYTRERYCGVQSGKPCAIVNNALVADCPKSNEASADTGCQTTKDDPNIPKDLCIGIIQLGKGDNASTIDGCWAK